MSLNRKYMIQFVHFEVKHNTLNMLIVYTLGYYKTLGFRADLMSHCLWSPTFLFNNTSMQLIERIINY